MPHATGDVRMGGTADEDFARGQQYLDEMDAGGYEAITADFDKKAIDQTDKAQDAEDYEDISDDDLPEEEGGDLPSAGDGDGMDGFLDEDMNGHAQTNGYHDAREPHSDDLFGGSDELFGERFSSPEQERQPPSRPAPQPQQRAGGLALPSKSGITPAAYDPRRPSQLQPTRQHASQRSPTSMSPPSFRSDGYSPAASPSVADSEDDLAGETDERVIQQRRLMYSARDRQAGKQVADEKEQITPDDFWSFFPSYEADQNPRFSHLFPQRSVKYRGKVPQKPPKPVQPTKISLDLMPDGERAFKSLQVAGKQGLDTSSNNNLIAIIQSSNAADDSDDEFGSIHDDELIGGVTMADLAMLCEDWSGPLLDVDTLDAERPLKRRRMGDADILKPIPYDEVSFEDPERTAAKFAKRVLLDENDQHLLIDTVSSHTARKVKHVPGDSRRDAAVARGLARRYDISNDAAYDLLKENHQHKIRSTLGATAVEHSMPATKLQYPFYRMVLDPKAKRSFHRPQLHIKDWEMRPPKEFKFYKPKTIKRKERRGREIKDLFNNAESLALNDNSNMLLLEYSEEAPMMMSNFGMGNRLINYYRKRNPDDQERPKREIGETQVLLTQDKSPFSNFGHVDQGEIVPTVQNGLYRAPVFQHQTKPTDFFVAISSTHEYGSRMYIRNMENLHTVGQQFPIAEVPKRNARKVTDAAKKRLRALAYRLYTKAQDPTRKDKVLDNWTLMKHLKGHDMPQTRSKMREFMKYDRPANKDHGVWVPMAGQVVPDAETMRSWVKPEDVCALDSMQVGVQRLTDLGLTIDDKEEDEKEEEEVGGNVERQLAPWRASRIFLQATQGKAMLALHGEGDPTGRGEGFSFVKTSMKGGFQALGESVEDKISAKKRRENGGHSYNVQQQANAYNQYIRMIWDKQKNSLSSNIELSDDEMDDIDEEPESAHPFGRAATPRSSFAGTPAGHRGRDEETSTQFSRNSADRGTGRVLIIRRTGGQNAYGMAEDSVEKITNPKVIREYIRRRNEAKLASINYTTYVPDGKDPELDRLVLQEIEKERDRIQKNVDRREARERLKGKPNAGSPSASAVGSPAPSDAEAGTPAAGSANGTPQKTGGRGRNKDGTARKCANCGQVGHIKTNRKLCPMLNGSMKTEDANPNGDSSFGAVPAPLTL